jgi:hypothetical protein
MSLRNDITDPSHVKIWDAEIVGANVKLSHVFMNTFEQYCGARNVSDSALNRRKNALKAYLDDDYEEDIFNTQYPSILDVIPNERRKEIFDAGRRGALNTREEYLASVFRLINIDQEKYQDPLNGAKKLTAEEMQQLEWVQRRAIIDANKIGAAFTETGNGVADYIKFERQYLEDQKTQFRTPDAPPTIE